MTQTAYRDLERKGDKENSTYFEESLANIYDRRKEHGLDELITRMRAVVVQVDTGDAGPYMAELTLMTPYRFRVAYQGGTHKVYVLTAGQEYPDWFVLEPMDDRYEDNFTRMDLNFPRARKTPNGRYLGEIYHVKDKDNVQKILEAQQIRFDDEHPNAFLRNKRIAFTQPSPFTRNIVGYTEEEMNEYDRMRLGDPFDLPSKTKKMLEASDAIQKEFGMFDLLYGIDHMATRIYSGWREDAILEFLTMTNYYFWGAYNIADMNSSTNVCRNPTVERELFSPAKVFTANNTPFFMQSFDGLPSPTEDFVRNFGPRMHHIAIEVEDGEQEDGTKNIDYVTGKLAEHGTAFLANIIGECTDFPDLKQIFSKSSEYSRLITEYVQRCKGYDGFFSKQNVAYLTDAAGQDEKLEPCDDCVKEAHEMGVGDS